MKRTPNSGASSAAQQLTELKFYCWIILLQ